MSDGKSILSYFKESDLVTSVIGKYSLLIVFNASLLFLCAVFEVFGVGMLVPVIESIGGDNQSSFFAKIAADAFEYFSIDYSPVNLLVVFGALILTRFLLLIYQQRLARVLSASITFDLRKQATENLLNTGLSYFSKKNIGELVSTIFVSSQNSGGLLEYFLLMVRGFIFCVAYIVTASILSIEFTLMVCVFIVISYFFVFPRFKKSQAYGGIEKNLMDDIFDQLQDRFSGIRTIKIFNQSNNVSDQIESLIDQSKNNDISIMDNKLISFAFFEPFLFLMMIISIIFGIQFLDLPISRLLVCLLVFTLIIPQFKLVNGNILQIKQLIPHFTKVNDLIRKDNKPLSCIGTQNVSELRESLVLDNVSFSYENSEEKVIQSVSITIPKNQFIAFVGPSGSGKSTLADLILRNYLPTSGRILLDDLNINDIEESSWRSLITIVDQDCYLFNESILNNIKYGYPDANDDEIHQAAKLSGAEDFINKLPDGYQTIVGNRGTSLSGGERQRISLARSMIMKPKILILDEATSSLDSLSEKIIQESLKTIRGATTLIVIAHRLSTIRQADNIFFIKDGRIAEQGNHEILLESDKDYKKFIEVQNTNE
jgi:ABC-type multidrug transport system fused ATPase/permease subunit